MLKIARPSTGLLAPAGFVTGGNFLSSSGFDPVAGLPSGGALFGSGAPVFGEGGLLGAEDKEEKEILEAPLDSFEGSNKKEKEASRKKAVKALRARKAREREESGNQPLLGSGAPLLAEGGLLGPQEQPQEGLLSEKPGFFEGLTRAASPGSLLNVLGRAVFGATEMERAENAAKRDEITSRQRQRQNLKEFTGLLDSGAEIPLGLLGRIAPEAVAEGLLDQRFPGQDRAEPSIIRELKAVGIDPMSAEGRELVLNKLKGQNAPDELLQRIQLQLSSLELESEREKIKDRAETKDRKFRATGVALRADLKSVAKLAQLNDALEGSALQTGTPFQDIRRSTAEGINEIMGLFDVDRSAARKIVSQRDAFNKLANNFLINSSARFGGGTLTDQKLSTLRDSMAGVGITPGANRVILADTLDALLEAAEIEGVTIANADAMRALASKLREQAGLLAEEPSGAEDIARNTPGFDRMSKKKQQELIELLRGQRNGQ